MCQNKTHTLAPFTRARIYYQPGVPGNLTPRLPANFDPPGPNFLGNLAPLGDIIPRKYAPPHSEIWPPRKHSLLYRYKLGNRSSKTKILKVFVSTYSWFA
jgi:hypothetical protein